MTWRRSPGLAICFMVALVPTPSAAPPRILVGPNVLVSRDGDFPHCETAISVNPKDPKNLVGAATTLSKPPDDSFMNRTYSSHDGGWTWAESSLPIEIEKGGGDPQVAYAPDGAALFVGIGSYGMAVHRSEDGGTTWGKPVLVKFTDHEQLAVDQTTGRFAGRIYIAGEAAQTPNTNERNSAVVLYRSDDGGRSFIGPVTVADSHGTGLEADPLAILSDGTLVVTLNRYPTPSQDKTTTTWSVECAVSSDGGLSFAPPSKIADVFFGGYGDFFKRKSAGRIDSVSRVVLAGGPATGELRDRLYAVWADFREGGIPRIQLAVSRDAGKTWSPPRAVDSDGPKGSSQFQPMLAVNNKGTVAVGWFDTRSFPQRDRYDVYFSASVDDGESFLPPVKVSSQPSNPRGPGNVRAVPLGGRNADPRKPAAMDFYSAFSTWPDGGDYLGMAADADGVFHPLWADARSGTFQLYTAPIQVLAVAREKKKVEKVAARINERVTLAYDPVSYDPSRQELSIPVRLRNDSKGPIYPPIRVEVKETVSPYFVKTKNEALASHPTILNASNGKSGEGAVFDYSSALGNLDSLDPGAMTEAVLWRVRVEGPSKTSIHFGTEITGLVKKAEK